MSIFLKLSNCRIIIAHPTYFENIQYCKIYFHYGLVLSKTNYNDSAFFFGRYSHFKFLFFLKMFIFLKFLNYRIIIGILPILKTSNIVKYTFTMVQVWLKLVTITLYFLEDIPILNFDFFKNVHFSQVFKLLHNYSPNYLF